MYFVHFMLLISAYLCQLYPKQPNKFNNNHRFYAYDNGYVYEVPVCQTQYIEVNTKSYHKVNDCTILQITRRNHLIGRGTVRTK